MDSTTPPRTPLWSTPAGQRLYIGLWVLGTLAVFGASVGAYFLGDYVGSPLEEVAPESVEDSALELPDLAGGPREPGEWLWNELRGGECVQGFDSPFAESFTVVPCSSGHQAELAKVHVVSRDETAEFPGEEALLSQAKQVCDVEGSLNRVEIQNYSDLVVQYSYPVDATRWSESDRYIYCFVTRQSGGTLTSSLLQ